MGQRGRLPRAGLNFHIAPAKHAHVAALAHAEPYVARYLEPSELHLT